MDKGRQAGNLLIRKVEAWHALLRAAIAHHGADLVSIHILGHQLGARKIRPALSAAGIPAMTKGAILLKEGAPALGPEPAGMICAPGVPLCPAPLGACAPWAVFVLGKRQGSRATEPPTIHSQARPNEENSSAKSYSALDPGSKASPISFFAQILAHFPAR